VTTHSSDRTVRGSPDTSADESGDPVRDHCATLEPEIDNAVSTSAASPTISGNQKSIPARLARAVTVRMRIGVLARMGGAFG
jgi:hypothetical protein